MGVADDAGNRLGLDHALLLDQQFQRAIAAPTSRHLKHAGLIALAIQHWPDVETLQEAASCDRGGEVLYRFPALDAPDIGLAQHQLVEGDVT